MHVKVFAYNVQFCSTHTHDYNVHAVNVLGEFNNYMYKYFATAFLKYNTLHTPSVLWVPVSNTMIEFLANRAVFC